MITAVALLPILAWDASRLDLPLARWFGTAQGFALEHNWWLERVLHNGARRATWVLEWLLLLLVLLPRGPLAGLPRADRIGLVIGPLVAVVAVQVIKRASLTSCPWDLAEFGGTAHHVSHWAWGVSDGGDGRCFPAGHASSGFCFLASWFWLRSSRPRLARIWLLVSLAGGFVLGSVQMLRGAHYLSHVLWAGWVCWVAGGAFWLIANGWRQRRARSPRAPDPAPAAEPPSVSPP